MLYIEIAKTSADHEKGLMFRKYLSDNAGMLFKFSDPKVLNFWGLNTYIPLDIAFIDNKNKIVKITKIAPMSLRTVSSDQPCLMAVEANDGYFKKNRVSEGDEITLEKDDLGIDIINFRKIKESKNNNQNNIVVAQLAENQNLPVIGIKDLPGILEDDIDEETEEGIEPEKIEEQPVMEEIPKEYPQFATKNEALEWAEQNTEVVRINYITKKGKNLIRDVEPHGQFYAKTTHHQIVVTFDRTMNAIRAFIISGIQGINFTGDEKFNKKFIVSVIR